MKQTAETEPRIRQRPPKEPGETRADYRARVFGHGERPDPRTFSIRDRWRAFTRRDKWLTVTSGLALLTLGLFLVANFGWLGAIGMYLMPYAGGLQLAALAMACALIVMAIWTQFNNTADALTESNIEEYERKGRARATRTSTTPAADAL